MEKKSDEFQRVGIAGESYAKLKKIQKYLEPIKGKSTLTSLIGLAVDLLEKHIIGKEAKK